MKFDINEYKGKFAMHCKTEEEARDFCNYLHSIGKRWYGGASYSNRTLYDAYKSNTAYSFNEDGYSSVTFFRQHNYTILEWSDFMNRQFTKADLKTGDVILRRNGCVEIVNRELEMLIRKSGYNDLDEVKDDLCHKNNPQLDILEVRRPYRKEDCRFESFNLQRGTLIYDRKQDEVQEMTLAEVCKLLGKNIKIVK